MKTIQLTLFKENTSMTYVVKNIKSYERVTDKWNNSFTILYLCDGSYESVHQTVEEITSLINS